MAHRDNIASQKVLLSAGLIYLEDEVEFGEPLKIYSIAAVNIWLSFVKEK